MSNHASSCTSVCLDGKLWPTRVACLALVNLRCFFCCIYIYIYMTTYLKYTFQCGNVQMAGSTECSAHACTQRASVHSEYLHFPWTDFYQILNAIDNRTQRKMTPPKKWRWPHPKNEDDPTQKMRTIPPNKWRRPATINEDDLSQTPSEHIYFCNGAVGLCGVRN